MSLRTHLNRTLGLALLAASSLLLTAGCGSSPPPQFQLNMVAMAEGEIVTEENLKDIATALEALFGTPDEPFVLPETKLDIRKLRLAAGPVRSDRSGEHTGLYREHCVHCHGISGDGMGPTAAFLKPYPRDYRQGKYKFKSTERAEPPTDEDLVSIIRHGIPGTAMPAFQVALTPIEIEALVEYVKYLSLRGQTEIAIVNYIRSEDKLPVDPVDRSVLIDEILLPEVEKWATANQKIIQAPEPPANFGTEASIALGREMFFSEKKANCVKCHGPTALGDGQRDDQDDWNKQIVTLRASASQALEKLQEQRREAEDDDEAKEIDKQIELQKWKLATLDAHTLPTRNIDPRNLRLGVYRGGRRPIDIYYRVFAGINGVPMPGTAGPAVTNEEMWHIVDYVLNLPYEPGGELAADRTVQATRARN